MITLQQATLQFQPFSVKTWDELRAQHTRAHLNFHLHSTGFESLELLCAS